MVVKAVVVAQGSAGLSLLGGMGGELTVERAGFELIVLYEVDIVQEVAPTVIDSRVGKTLLKPAFIPADRRLEVVIF